MACFKPIEAIMDGFDQVRIGHGIQEREQGRAMWLPCGKCLGCQQKRQRDWALRCMHEAQMRRENAFVTLTYDEKNYKPSLEYRDFRLFLKRLKREARKVRHIRFFVAGEYGKKTGRPHWHAILFGYWPGDAVDLGGFWVSEELTEIWGHGFTSVGTVTHESAMYVAKYCCKDLHGHSYRSLDMGSGELLEITPEFARMSLKPGIGAEWFEKYWKDVYEARDGVVQKGGKLLPSPRYYDKLLAEKNAELMEHKQGERYRNAARFLGDCTEQRLKEREAVARANHKRKVTQL